jgi:hypothetical protein
MVPLKGMDLQINIDEQTYTQLSKKQPDVLHPPLTESETRQSRQTFSSLEGGSVSLLHLALMYSSATKHFSPYEGGLRGMTFSN